MTDRLTPSQRHYVMSRIHGKGTKPELLVRQWLWRHGYRYRLNVKSVPGKPDIVLRKYRTAVFVNGCFWHGHNTQCIIHNSQFIIESSECCKIPKTNREFWVAKIRRNKERDKEEKKQLAAMGWHCITVWECELTPKKREETLESIAFTLNHIWLQDHQARVVPYPKLEEENRQMPMAAEEIDNEIRTK